MVYLNKVISVNIKLLEKWVLEKLGNEIEDELDYVHNITDERKEKIKNNILKRMKYEMKKDNFVYRIMDEKKCVYKHKIGNKDGYFCHKNITKNGDKNEYLCRIHNKHHVPEKKIIKNIPIKDSINIIKENRNKINNIIKNKTSEDISSTKNKKENDNVLSLNNILNNDKPLLLNKNKSNNIYKYLTLNSEYKYEILFKEFSLLDFVINKFKNSKNKKWIDFKIGHIF